MDKIVSGWIESGFLVVFYPLKVQLQLVRYDDSYKLSVP